MKPLVCVLDDNSDTAESLSLILQLHGYDVFTATQPADALIEIRRSRPAAAVIDLAMPLRDGYSVARELRADARTRGMRLIAFSALGSAETVRASRDAGFDYFVLKPCDAGILLACLRGEAEVCRSRSVPYEFEVLNPRANLLTPA